MAGDYKNTSNLPTYMTPEIFKKLPVQDKIAYTLLYVPDKKKQGIKKPEDYINIPYIKQPGKVTAKTLENRTGGQGNSIMENYAKMPLAEKLDYALKYGTSSKEMMERLKSGTITPAGDAAQAGKQDNTPKKAVEASKGQSYPVGFVRISKPLDEQSNSVTDKGREAAHQKGVERGNTYEMSPTEKARHDMSKAMGLDNSVIRMKDAYENLMGNPKAASEVNKLLQEEGFSTDKNGYLSLLIKKSYSVKDVREFEKDPAIKQLQDITYASGSVDLDKEISDTQQAREMLQKDLDSAQSKTKTEKGVAVNSDNPVEFEANKNRIPELQERIGETDEKVTRLKNQKDQQEKQKELGAERQMDNIITQDIVKSLTDKLDFDLGNETMDKIMKEIYENEEYVKKLEQLKKLKEKGNPFYNTEADIVKKEAKNQVAGIIASAVFSDPGLRNKVSDPLYRYNQNNDKGKKEKSYLHEPDYGKLRYNDKDIDIIVPAPQDDTSSNGETVDTVSGKDIDVDKVKLAMIQLEDGSGAGNEKGSNALVVTDLASQILQTLGQATVQMKVTDTGQAVLELMHTNYDLSKFAGQSYIGENIYDDTAFGPVFDGFYANIRQT